MILRVIDSKVAMSFWDQKPKHSDTCTLECDNNSIFWTERSALKHTYRKVFREEKVL